MWSELPGFAKAAAASNSHWPYFVHYGKEAAIEQPPENQGAAFVPGLRCAVSGEAS
jgi:hypothetical protein